MALKKNFPLRVEIGVVLMMIGVQFGTALRNMVPSIPNISNIIMMASVMLVCNYSNLVKSKFPCFDKRYIYLLLFECVVLLYSCIEVDDPVGNGIKYRIMSLFLILSVFVLSSNKKKLKFRYLYIILFYSSGFIATIVAYQATKGFTGLYLENVFYNALEDTSGMAEGGDKITMGRALLLCFLSAFFYKPRYKFENILRIVFLVFPFIGLFMFNSRSPLMVIFICLLLHLWKMIKNKEVKISKILQGTAIVVVMMLIAYMSLDYVAERINSMFESVKIGVLTLVGITQQGEDVSTATRTGLIDSIVKPSLENGNILNYICGFGYYHYLDIPILQAFFDFGIFGFLYFAFMIRGSYLYIFKKRFYGTQAYIIQLFAVQYFVDQFICDTPLCSFAYMPLIILIFLNKCQKTAPQSKFKRKQNISV